MTTREFYVAVINGEMNDEMVEKATALLATMDKAKETAKNKPSKAALANEKYLTYLKANVLTSEGKIGSELADALTTAFAEDFNEKPCSATKVASILKASVADGTVIKDKTKIDKSERTTYALAE